MANSVNGSTDFTPNFIPNIFGGSETAFSPPGEFFLRAFGLDCRASNVYVRGLNPQIESKIPLPSLTVQDLDIPGLHYSRCHTLDTQGIQSFHPLVLHIRCRLDRNNRPRRFAYGPVVQAYYYVSGMHIS